VVLPNWQYSCIVRFSVGESTTDDPDPATPPSGPSSGTPSVRSTQGRYLAGERVQITFAGASQNGADRVTIAPLGSPDPVRKMWLYTNGSQRQLGSGPTAGALQFRSEYIGIGPFEARLFSGGKLTPNSRAVFEIEGQ